MGGRVLAAISLLIALGQMSVRKSRAGGWVELKPGACCRCEPAHQLNTRDRGFPGGPVVKNSPSNAGDKGLLPGWGTKISYAMGQLSLHSTLEKPELCSKTPAQPKLKKSRGRRRTRVLVSEASVS